MLEFRVEAGRPDRHTLLRAAAILRSGGIVAYPTDTLYGLAANPASAAAMAQLYRIKGRPVDAAIPLIASGVPQIEAAGGVLGPGLVSLQDIWILWENSQPVGYALIQADQTFLTITNLVLKMGMDPVEAVSAITASIKTDYVKVKISRPTEIESLRRAGYRVAHPDWGAFMVKPLLPEITAGDAVRLFGIGTDRFLISWLGTT